MTLCTNKVIAVIPAHMASVRFPGKILFDIHGLPMIEHVRRRALLADSIADVIVASCDNQIAAVIRGFGGKVVMTSDQHINGSSRVAEALLNLDCTHVIVLQGDEPLLIPAHIDALVDSIAQYPKSEAWNVTGLLENYEELDKHSFVKCAVTTDNQILHCFRRSPSYSAFDLQQKFIRKILGIFAFRKEFLLELVKLEPSLIETAEFIEQMRILENGFQMRSVPVEPSLPSVNEPEDVDTINNFLRSNSDQKNLLATILRA